MNGGEARAAIAALGNCTRRRRDSFRLHHLFAKVLMSNDEPRSARFESIDGQPHLVGDWPTRMVISVELITNGDGRFLSREEDRITFRCANSTAVYLKRGEDGWGDWVCGLVEASRTPAIPAAEKVA